MILLKMLTPKAKKWAKENIQYESWQIFGEAIAIDNIKMAENIFEGLKEAGFKSKDFEMRKV